MARPSNTEERRAQITRAMMKLIGTHGYDRATISDVAVFANLTAGLVHYHFENKLEILLEVMEEIFSTHAINLDVRLALGRGNPFRELHEFIAGHLGSDGVAPMTFSTASPEMVAALLKYASAAPTPGRTAVKCWVTFAAEALREPAVARAYRKAMRGLVERLERIIAGGVKAGVFKCRDARAAAGAIMAAIQGCFSIETASPGVIPKGTAARSVLHMAHGLLWPLPEEKLRG